MKNNLQTILFDLDGTLLDTHLDMCAALNVILNNHGKPEIPAVNLRPFVSKGSMVMVCLAFKCLPGSEQSKQLWQEMIDAYAENIANHTNLFPGMDAVLEKIQNNGQRWGIVTNKPGHLTRILLKELSLPFKPHVVVSGDTLKVKKPDPGPLLYACQQIDANPETAMYIGDDERDIQAGKSAGMQTLAASYGYITDEENPEEWNANGIISEAEDILNWIN